MRNLFKANFIFLVFLIITSCARNKELLVSYSNPEVVISGRIDTTSVDAAELFWSGTTIEMNFKGESVSAQFSDERGDNYYNVILDNDSIFILRPDTTKQYHLLAAHLSDKPHNIKLFKRTEFDRGISTFYGFKIDGHPEILPAPAPKKRKIEFYGNSITAGYAVEDFSGKDRPDSTFTNNYLSYAAITARHYNADYRCICKSGIGITISWFPYIMPDIYDRLNPSDPNSHWDFSLYTPDIVVVNLFQNDSWLVNMPKRQEFKDNFGTKAPDDDFIVNAYASFVQSIRKEYPETEIICILGSMDATREGSKWPGYITQAVEQLNDPKIFTHFIPYKNTPGHPSIAEQQEMANSLIQFIDKNIKW